MKSELSKRNPYWIEKHRYYELRHFCLQYPIWKSSYNSLYGLSKHIHISDVTNSSKTKNIPDPTATIAGKRMFYSDRMKMIMETAKNTDESLAKYLVCGVTEGLSYDTLRARHNIPCCRDTYYDMYRKFFWLLSNVRD